MLTPLLPLPVFFWRRTGTIANLYTPSTHDVVGSWLIFTRKGVARHPWRATHVAHRARAARAAAIFMRRVPGYLRPRLKNHFVSLTANT